MINDVKILKAIERAGIEKAAHSLSSNSVFAELEWKGSKLGHIVSNGFNYQTWSFYPADDSRMKRNDKPLEEVIPKWATGATWGRVYTSYEATENLAESERIKAAAEVDAALERLTGALAEESFPCNPIPFANGLADLVRGRGTDSIKSDDAKRILWVLMGQAYGQLATIDLSDEWDRLTNRGGTKS